MEKRQSKKQFQTSSANGHMENINVSQIDLISQKKKKKRKMENDERNYSISQQSILEVEESQSKKKKKKKREQEELEESPRKKKKSNKEAENTALQTSTVSFYAQDGIPRTKRIKKEKNEIETVEPVLDENWWPPEERTAMLEAMKAQIPVTGRFTRVGYLTHLRKTNWDDVLSAINSRTQGNSRTIKQCQDHFHKLLNKVGTIKSLNQIVDEALSLATDPSALRREVTQARHRFIKDYMSRHKGGENCTIMVATRVWTTLPAEEKDKWEEEYQNELRQKGLLVAKTSKSKKLEGPENCKFPFELYQEARDAKGEELSSADAKSKYSSLSLKKKIPFIVESLKQQKVYEAEAAKYLEKNPTWKKTKAHGPTNKEIKDYLESLGLPLAPPNNVVGMYYMEEKEKFTEGNKNDSVKVKSINESFRPYQRAREAFSSLPKEQQNQYKSEWRKSWIEYLSEVEKWRPMVEEKYPEILEHALAALVEVKAPKNVAEPSEKKELVRKKPVDPLSHIKRQTSHLTNIKFNEEPPLPARTAYELFQQKFKRDAGSNYTPSKAKEFFGRLSDEKKVIYNERVDVLKQRSKSNFLIYAKNLESEQRKLFVGVKREKLVKYFQEDIFAEDYPGADYPILIASSRKDNNRKDIDLSEEEYQPSKPSNSNKGGIKALAAKTEETIKESSEEESDDEDHEVELGSEEKEQSSSDNDSSDSSSDSDSEVEASQPTVVSPFSLPKSGEDSARLSNIAISSPFSAPLPSKEESSDSEDDSDEESESDDDKENQETPVSSRVQSKPNQKYNIAQYGNVSASNIMQIQRSGGATSTLATKENMSSDSESSSESSSESEDDSKPMSNNTSTKICRQ